MYALYDGLVHAFEAAAGMNDICVLCACRTQWITLCFHTKAFDSVLLAVHQVHFARKTSNR